MHVVLIVLLVMVGLSVVARGLRWGTRYGLQMGLQYGGMMDDRTAARLRERLARRARRRGLDVIDLGEEFGAPAATDEAMARALAERDQQLDDLNKRVYELEERLDFTERLLAGRRADAALTPPSAPQAPQASQASPAPPVS